jgi:hypothetical protein
MITNAQRIIHEKSNIIPINKNLFTKINNYNLKKEYSLTQHIFDPANSSPPNDFMIKLCMRITKYNEDNDDYNKNNE